MKKMKLKNKKKQIHVLVKLLLIIFLFSFSFCITLKYFTKNIDNEEFIKLLLENNNSYIEKNKNRHIFSRLITLITNIDFSKPNTMLVGNYISNNNNNNNNNNNGFTSSDDDKDIDTIPKNNYVKDPYDKKEITNPIIYLYNTHQSEEYKMSNSESYNVKPTVMMTSYILREKLNNNGLNTIVEENDVTEFLRTNNWNYTYSYKVTKLLMTDAYSKNNTLKYFIDLHRDSVKKSISTVSIDNKTYARILFIVGLENKNYEPNLKLTTILNDMFNEKYPGLSRGIYKKKGAGVNGVYNQDFSPNTILIEIGGQDNTIDEVFNTCEAISAVLTEYIREAENEK